MTKHIYLSIFLLLGLLTTPVLAETQVITLKDGSTIKGELVGINNGVYTIHTDTLGDVKIKTSEVANISSGAASPKQESNANNGIDQKIQSAQTKLMSDPAMMTKIQEMMQDPELMKIFSDPELVEAVTSRNVKTIESNPKAQALMKNPKMRELMDEMHGKGY